mmetsp:Transcript_22590/g.57211  ORF Transcript_22590/g.57211 Transcript_22590/m.57211 type:complete len:210 (-) Transcript_22590:2057-2686(-)
MESRAQRELLQQRRRLQQQQQEAASPQKTHLSWRRASGSDVSSGCWRSGKSAATTSPKFSTPSNRARQRGEVRLFRSTRLLPDKNTRGLRYRGTIVQDETTLPTQVLTVLKTALWNWSRSSTATASPRLLVWPRREVEDTSIMIVPRGATSPWTPFRTICLRGLQFLLGWGTETSARPNINKVELMLFPRTHVHLPLQTRYSVKTETNA